MSFFRASSGARLSEIERVSSLELGELHTSQKPLTPSAHVTSLDSKETIAGLRDTTAAALGSALEGGLDQIIMKAIAMDRTHRYETALELAMDLERYDRREPVRAPSLLDAAARLKRHLAVVMFTDVEGYTALMQRDEDAAVALRERHRRAVEGAAAAHNGHLRQYFGDGSPSVPSRARSKPWRPPSGFSERCGARRRCPCASGSTSARSHTMSRGSTAMPSTSRPHRKPIGGWRYSHIGSGLRRYQEPPDDRSRARRHCRSQERPGPHRPLFHRG